MDGEIKVIVALAAANQKMARYGDFEKAGGSYCPDGSKNPRLFCLIITSEVS